MSTKIVSLELKGYKRLALNNIDHFTFKPTEKTQVILGTNGCGKSSLLRELNPMPAHPSNYRKDGFKIIEIIKGKNSYRLESIFDPKPQHNFWKNGENLNEGGTITVQRDLVFREFGIDQSVIDLLTYSDKFTAMSPLKRREWLARLDEASYDYAISVFNRLKERHRDVVGAKKLAKKRLVLETSKLISDQEQERLRKEIQNLHESITILLENKAPNVSKTYNVIDELNDSMQLLQEEANVLIRSVEKVSSTSVDGYDISSRSTIDRELLDVHATIAVEESHISSSVAEHNKLEQLYRSIRENRSEGITNVEEAVRPIIDERSALVSSKRLALVFDEPESTLRSVEAVECQLLDVFLNIAEDPAGACTVAALEETKDKIVSLTLKKEKLQSELGRLVEDKKHLEHLRDGVKTACPRCNHIWTPGYNPDAYAQLLEKIEAKAAIIDDLEQGAIKTASARKEELLSYLVLERDYVRCKRSWEVLRPIWDLMDEENFLKTNPKYITVFLDTLKSDLLADIKIVKLDERLKGLDELKQTLIKEEISNIQEIEEKLSTLSDEISNHTERLSKFKKDKAELQRLRDAIDSIRIKQDRIKDLYKKSSSLCDELVENERQSVIARTIKELQLSLANKETALSEITNQNQIVAELEKQIAEFDKDEVSCAHLIESLSPTDGIIAEGLFGFIKVFVKQMNRLMARAWTYKLEIVPCGLGTEGSVELDYKFPLIIKSDSNSVPDVANGSEAMIEIVNVAFVIVAMKYLGLGDYWIILDEFARAMDHGHKRQSVELMKSIMDEMNFSQLYMVSHDFLQYDGIGNKEVCVLSPNNIVLPDVYNRHVTIA